ncbi:MAG: gfo/Idh/MocA family oxidoreductase, partial [Chlorobia bacterium]|nr:gfo/Idh/MocA family oxidoreductase [Fimbriimonadaceae bacterium]
LLDIIEAWAVNMGSFEGSSILGSKGGIRMNPFSFHKSFGDIDINGTAELGSARYRWHNVGENGSFYSESQRHWVAALQGKVPLIPTAEIALNTMLISEGIYLSSSKGREVTVDEVRSESVSTAGSL